MELLLILSALLGALTGVTGTRAPEVRLHRAAAVAQAVTRMAPVRSSALRPVDAGFALAALSQGPMLRAFALVPAVPIYSGRRRQ